VPTLMQPAVLQLLLRTITPFHRENRRIQMRLVHQPTPISDTCASLAV
jgi:hypothetical protein